MHKILAVGIMRDGGPRKTLPNVIGGGQLGGTRAIVRALVKGLQGLGHAPGVSFEVDYSEDEQGALAKCVREALKASRYDVIFPIGSSAVRAASAATKSVPIVSGVISDPIEQGVAKSCGSPGKNVTGIRTTLRHTAADCLELFKATVPSLKTVYVLHQPDFHKAKVKTKKKPPKPMETLHLAAQNAKLKLQLLPVKKRGDIAVAMGKVRAEGPPGKPSAGLLVHPDDLVISEGLSIIRQASDKKIPTFFPVVEFVNSTPDSALGGYGIPPEIIGEGAARYVDKILKGAHPGHMPFKRAGGFVWAVNTDVAGKLNLVVPPEVLKAADRVEPTYSAGMQPPPLAWA